MASQHTRIVSAIPGRTRIKVSRKRRSRKEMSRMAEAIRKADGIDTVRTNLPAGCIVVHHDDSGRERIRKILRDLGVILASATDLEIPSEAGESKTGLVGAVSDLNRRFAAATGYGLDLRLLLPLGLGALALRQLLRYGLQLEIAPWYVLAYVAFDSYVKLHQPEPSVQGVAGEGARASAS